MLIFVSGLSGAGKTTLVQAALQAIPELTYLKTVTTRPKRSGEDDSLEYRFVSDTEYDALRSQSTEWDHTEYNGFRYGADVAAANRLLDSGKHLICNVAPDLLVIQAMRDIYHISPLLIWIDTPAATARQRTADDEIRAARQEDARLKQRFDRVFATTADRQHDKDTFIRMLRYLLESGPNT